MINKLINTILLVGFSSLAFAHQGHALDSGYSGFMHPIMGWDHLLLMLAVGLWAARLGGSARWQLPVAFISFMGLGSTIGFMGVSFSWTEAAIAISLIGMSLLLTYKKMSRMTAISILSAFAFIHGIAHGLELVGQQQQLAMLGMVLATAMLHGIGYLLCAKQGLIQRCVNVAFSLILLLSGSWLLLS